MEGRRGGAGVGSIPRELLLLVSVREREREVPGHL